MHTAYNRTLASLGLRASLCVVAGALAGLPATARAQGPAAPVKDAPAGAPAKDAGAKPFEVGITAASMGAFDSNVFDKGTDPTMAAGGDVNVGIGVPLGSRVAWASGGGLGSNARQGIDRSAGDTNALRVDAHLKTGLEFLLFGKTSMPGRPTKKPRYPALRLAVEAKYAYWSNPFITQPKAATDSSIDALEPTDTSRKVTSRCRTPRTAAAATERATASQRVKRRREAPTRRWSRQTSRSARRPSATRTPITS